MLCFFMAGIALACAQVVPAWVFKMPVPGNNTYLYSVESGTATTELEARNQAIVRVFQTMALRLGMPVNSQAISKAVQQGEAIEVISTSYNLPINKVCEYTERVMGGGFRVYVLCQVARAGNIMPQWDVFTECVDEQFMERAANWREQASKRRKQEAKKAEREERRKDRKTRWEDWWANVRNWNYDFSMNMLDVSNVKQTSAMLHGEIVTDDEPKWSERGFVYGTSSMPTMDNAMQKLTVAITKDKAFSTTVTGLTTGQIYYVRAYAVNAGKTVYSTNEVSFVPDMALPIVATRAVSDKSVSMGMASLNGTITDAGDPAYTERGFVYGTMHNPTVEGDTKAVVSGGGAGGYSINLSGLAMGTVYYVRAYATNERGTAYGEEVTLDMNAVMPGVVTGKVEIKEASAVFNGTITEVGDPAYTERGFVYGTMLIPLLDNGATKVVVNGTIPGAFNAEMTDLTEMETYRVRAYAISPAGVEYGEVEQFIFADPVYAAYLSFPTFKHGGHTYRVYPDLGEKFKWEQANALCENLTYAGYDDWMLPSKELLMTMYLNKDDIGGFIETCYWSSDSDYQKLSDTNGYYRYCFVYLDDGDSYYWRDNDCRVRPVRLEE